MGASCCGNETTKGTRDADLAKIRSFTISRDRKKELNKMPHEPITKVQAIVRGQRARCYVK